MSSGLVALCGTYFSASCNTEFVAIYAAFRRIDLHLCNALK
jgi:hypothetical protein